VIDDSACDPGVSKYLSHFRTRFANSDNLKLKQEWTGIMGFTADECPLVGQLPSKPDCYIAGNIESSKRVIYLISAGFSGHGMPRVYLSGKALAELIMRGILPAWLPRAYHITTERLTFLQSQVFN
jgi:glycine/D-amino acid oxidase-like deaminating enzyme